MHQISCVCVEEYLDLYCTAKGTLALLKEPLIKHWSACTASYWCFNGAVYCKLQRLWQVSGLIWPVFQCGNYVEGWLRKRSYWPWSTLPACGSSKQNTGFRKDNRPECSKRNIFFNLLTIQKMPTGKMMSLHLLYVSVLMFFHADSFMRTAWSISWHFVCCTFRAGNVSGHKTFPSSHFHKLQFV